MKKIVHKVEEGMNPSEIYCTTYQMRNFYAQMADGFFSSLDIMNYIQHHAAVKRMKKNWRVLDVCCGRGMLLPLIRYYKPQISEYVGIDISQTNIREQLRKSGIKKINNAKSYYPFKLTQVIKSVEYMNEYFEKNSFDFIIYTSSIEHMQKGVGYKSLQHSLSILKPGHEMFLSCPNTSDKRDPYDTQYAAHIYEWGLNELRRTVKEIGFKIVAEYGLVGKVRDFERFINSSQNKQLKTTYYQLKEYMPTNWLMSFIPILYPEAAAEVLLILKKPNFARKTLL